MLIENFLLIQIQTTKIVCLGGQGCFVCVCSMHSRLTKSHKILLKRKSNNNNRKWIQSKERNKQKWNSYLVFWQETLNNFIFLNYPQKCKCLYKNGNVRWTNFFSIICFWSLFTWFLKRNEVGSRRKSLLSEGGFVNDITAGREREQAQKCVFSFVNYFNFMKSIKFFWVFLFHRFISNFAINSRWLPFRLMKRLKNLVVISCVCLGENTWLMVDNDIMYTYVFF